MTLHSASSFQIVKGATQGLRDVADFLLHLSDSQSCGGITFNEHRPVFIARAPGRLDLMGGIADYSGSLVLQLPIAEATLVALQRDSAPIITISSLSHQAEGEARRFTLPLSDLLPDGNPIEYEAARAYFRRAPASHWAAYVAGAFLALMRERGIRFSEGARLVIDSRVPEGKGVSSSAAIEVATMQALTAAFDVEISAPELALLCQKVENLVAGAPCGVMDQMASMCGEADSLLELLCQPAQLLGTVAIPDELAVWGIDSGVRHSVSGADYGSVRVAAFMGYRLICEMAGLPVQQRDGRTEIIDTRWHGYLANVTPAEFEQQFARALPEQITGAEFLSRYGGLTDTVTRVAPERSYSVRAATAHPVYEHFRVRTFAELWRGHACERQRELLGELMSQSHASYSACGLGSEGTDLLVALARKIGCESGLYGAKITGGGSGGTVAVLAHREAAGSLNQLVAAYAARTGHQPQMFRGSSPGAAAFGWIEVQLKAS